MKKFIQVKELEKLRVALNNLQDPDKWKIVMMLKEAGEQSAAYSEIKNLFGKDYNDNTLWRHLKSLMKADLIEHVRGLVKYNPETGKARVSFYRLSNYGKALLETYLEEIIGVLCTLESEMEKP